MVRLFLRWYRKHRLEFMRYQHQRRIHPMDALQHMEAVLGELDYPDTTHIQFGLSIASRVTDALVLLRLLEEINVSLITDNVIRYNRRHFSEVPISTTCTKWFWAPLYKKGYTLKTYQHKVLQLLKGLNTKLATLHQQQPRYVEGHLQDIVPECSVLLEFFIEIRINLETNDVKN